MMWSLHIAALLRYFHPFLKNCFPPWTYSCWDATWRCGFASFVSPWIQNCNNRTAKKLYENQVPEQKCYDYTPEMDALPCDSACELSKLCVDQTVFRIPCKGSSFPLNGQHWCASPSPSLIHRLCHKIHKQSLWCPHEIWDVFSGHQDQETSDHIIHRAFSALLSASFPLQWECPHWFCAVVCGALNPHFV